MKSKANIFWCTGLSGSGKSTLAEYAKVELESLGFTVLILDGDVVREKYKVQLGFDTSNSEIDYEEVESESIVLASKMDNEFESSTKVPYQIHEKYIEIHKT